MADFKKIKIASTSGAQIVEGEIVLESSTYWQLAVDGKVSAYAKKDFQEVPGAFTSNPFAGGGVNDIFGGMFGGRR